MDLKELDHLLIWHPFTQEKSQNELPVITKGKGSYLYDEKGHALLDLVSSWWVNIHGHAHPLIAKAISNQCITLEHVMFAGFSHQPAITLCHNLSQVLPQSLCKFFFSDNGSTAVEVALKMSYQYWKNQGCLGRSTFLSFEGAYHGDTWGSMSVGLASGYHRHFADLCFGVDFVPYPHTWMGDTEVNHKEEFALSQLQQILQKKGDSIAALIVEPLVQGAAGMRTVRPGFIDKVVHMVRKDHHILVIFDEVMTGFGRTGTIFATDQTEVVPDLLCLSKGLTGGFVPLSLTVTTSSIYDAFLGDTSDTAFLHGHSYTANPVACAAAIASLQLLRSEQTKEAIQAISSVHKEMLESKLVPWSVVVRPRVIGTIAAFDVEERVDVEKLKEKCLQRGIILRPLSRTVYLMPPYSTLPHQLQSAYKVIFELLTEYL